VRPLDEEIRAYYDRGEEAARLDTLHRLEGVRTRELLERFLPQPPARVLDVGGGAGAHAVWLAERGYEVHLIDPMPLHVEQAEAASREAGQRLASATVGDAHRLDHADASADSVLLLGPLYHLTRRAERLAALAEARRVLRSDGALMAAAISRFAPALEGLRKGRLLEPGFREIAERDLQDGQHRNPTRNPRWFTTAYLHAPAELHGELVAARFDGVDVLAIEGMGEWIP